MIDISQYATDGEKQLFTRWNQAVEMVRTVVVATSQEIGYAGNFAGELPDIQVSLAVMNTALRTLKEVQKEAETKAKSLKGKQFSLNRKVYWVIVVVNFVAFLGSYAAMGTEAMQQSGNPYILAGAIAVGIFFHAIDRIKEYVLNREIALEARISDLSKISYQGSGLIERVEAEFSMFRRVHSMGSQAREDERSLVSHALSGDHAECSLTARAPCPAERFVPGIGSPVSSLFSEAHLLSGPLGVHSPPSGAPSLTSGGPSPPSGHPSPAVRTSADLPSQSTFPKHGMRPQRSWPETAEAVISIPKALDERSVSLHEKDSTDLTEGAASSRPFRTRLQREQKMPPPFLKSSSSLNERVTPQASPTSSPTSKRGVFPERISGQATASREPGSPRSPAVINTGLLPRSESALARRSSHDRWVWALQQLQVSLRPVNLREEPRSLVSEKPGGNDLLPDV